MKQWLMLFVAVAELITTTSVELQTNPHLSTATIRYAPTELVMMIELLYDETMCEAVNEQREAEGRKEKGDEEVEDETVDKQNGWINSWRYNELCAGKFSE